MAIYDRELTAAQVANLFRVSATSSQTAWPNHLISATTTPAISQNPNNPADHDNNYWLTFSGQPWLVRNDIPANEPGPNVSTLHAAALSNCLVRMTVTHSWRRFHPSG